LGTQKKDSVNILCTSDGAYSTVNVLSSNKYIDLIDKVILLDPADYYLTFEDVDEPDFIWSGYEEFDPKGAISSV